MKKQQMIYLEEDTIKELKIECAKKDITISRYIQNLLNASLVQKEKKEPGLVEKEGDKDVN